MQGKTAFEPLFLGQTVSGGVVALVWLHIPGPRVKAIIALSIMFVASEALACDHANPRLSERALNRRLWLWPDPRVGFRRMIGRPRLDPVKTVAVYGIGIVAAFWFVERVAGFVLASLPR